MNVNINELSFEARLGQLFVIGIPGTEIDEETGSMLSEIQPGGVCLFSRNIRTAQQTRDLLDSIRGRLPVVPVLALDQEGGTVDRLRRIVTPLAAANRVRSSDEAARMGSLIGETISILGFNMDFAPVVDVVDSDRSNTSNGLFSRPFGHNKDEAVEFAGEFLFSLQRSGPLGCLKHFPGLGAARVDSHEELPTINVDREEFQATDLFPYQELIASGQVHGIMAAHAAYPKLDLQERGQNGKLLPSSLSKNIITNLLRGELGFEGLVITDDLEMGAIIKNFGIGEAAILATLAGADMLAICAGPESIRTAFASVKDAVRTGRISESVVEEHILRIAQTKAMLADARPFDAVKIADLSSKIEDFNTDLDAI